MARPRDAQGQGRLDAPNRRHASVMGASAVVGTTIPMAVGYAMARQMQKKPIVVACFFGDGACEEGVFNESLNFAAFKRNCRCCLFAKTTPTPFIPASTIGKQSGTSPTLPSRIKFQVRHCRYGHHEHSDRSQPGGRRDACAAGPDRGFLNSVATDGWSTLGPIRISTSAIGRGTKRRNGSKTTRCCCWEESFRRRRKAN